jgi:hypothetical protein
MEQRQQTAGEKALLDKSRRNSRQLALILLVIGVPVLGLALYFALRTDWLGAGIIAGITLIFMIPGVGNLFVARRLAADLTGNITLVRTCRIRDKRISTTGKGAVLHQYIVRLEGVRREYWIGKDSYDRLTPGMDLIGAFAPVTRELLSLMTTGGETVYPLS